MTVLGIDIGTTGTKALAVREDGVILGRGYFEYALSSRPGGIVEQDADDWKRAVISSVLQATANISDKGEITALSLSTQGATMTAVDRDFTPLCPAITWMDTRASRESAKIAETVGANTVYRSCGWAQSATSDDAKILWLKNNRSDIYKKTFCFVSTLEYINHMLTGQCVSDPTNSAIRGMYNITSNTWDTAICDAAGASPGLLPRVYPTGHYIGTLSASAAKALGLCENVAVYNGAHDQYCAALGCGALACGDMLVSTGTTWVILGVTGEAVYTDSFISPGIHPASSDRQKLYGAMASLTSAGSALKWLKNTVGAESYSEIDRIASERIHNSSDLFFMPYIAGAGFPDRVPTMGGGCIGMKLHHDKYDLALALMEGVAFEAKNALGEFSRHGIDIKSLKMTGGAAKSDLWCALTGYITGCEITSMNESEGCALGAAMIAAVKSDMFKSFDEAASVWVSGNKINCENDALFCRYNEKHDKYSALARAVKGVIKTW